MRRTKYAIFEIRIMNAKKQTTEYREYAITVRDDASGDKMAWEAANAYAQRCVSRYRAGSTYTVEKIGLEEERA